jgi:hypothetical protein
MTPQYRDDLEPKRQQVIDILTSAFADNTISMDEYERRAALASATAMPEVLDEVIADLPAVRPADSRKTGSSRYSGHEHDAARQPYRPGSAGSDVVGAPPMTTGCVMGERNLTGNWLCSDRVTSFTIMGSTKLDLRDTDLPPGPVKVEVFTLMGETKIVVPPDLPVRLNAFAFMGESTAHRSVDQQVRGARTWVEISGFVMMGSVNVKAMD